jgi:hypothetical protein
MIVSCVFPNCFLGLFATNLSIIRRDFFCRLHSENFLVILLVIIPGGVYAQEKPEGAYYLQGVMEVASGFLIKPNSSFNSFFPMEPWTGRVQEDGAFRVTIFY